MNRFSEWSKKTGAGIIAGTRRFPAAVAAAFAIMALGFILNHNDQTLQEPALTWLVRVMLTLGLGVPLTVALQLFTERITQSSVTIKVSLWVALATLLAVYLLTLLPNTDKAAPILRYLALLLAATALVPAVPYFLKRQGDERFALKLLLRLLITFLFTGILIGGVDLILLMVDKLLNVRLWAHAYEDVALMGAGLFSPSFLLAGVPKGALDFEDEHYPGLVRVLLGYIGYPLLAAYTAIIYINFIQIMLRWSWPRNTLVNMVLWYTAIGVLTLYFMRMQNESNKWFRLFDRWYPRLTVLPLALMLAGLSIRIFAYGITERRYFVLVLALWVAAATAMAILSKPEKRRNVVVPALLAALAALAVLGPWNAFAVSSASQNARLGALLGRNGMLDTGGKLIPAQNVPDGDKQQIYDILDYFDRDLGLGMVKVLPTGTTSQTLPQALGFDRTVAPGSTGAGIYINATIPVSMLDVSGYDYIFINANGVAQSSPAANVEMAIDDQSVFTIRKSGLVIYSKDLREYEKSFESGYVQNKVYTLDELTKVDDNGRANVKFIFNQISIGYDNNIAQYMVPSFYALIKVK